MALTLAARTAIPYLLETSNSILLYHWNEYQKNVNPTGKQNCLETPPNAFLICLLSSRVMSSSPEFKYFLWNKSYFWLFLPQWIELVRARRQPGRTVCCYRFFDIVWLTWLWFGICMLKGNGRRSSRRTGEVGFWRGQNTSSCGMSSFWATGTGFVIDLRQQLIRTYSTNYLVLLGMLFNAVYET